MKFEESERLPAAVPDTKTLNRFRQLLQRYCQRHRRSTDAARNRALSKRQMRGGGECLTRNEKGVGCLSERRRRRKVYSKVEEAREEKEVTMINGI